MCEPTKTAAASTTTPTAAGATTSKVAAKLDVDASSSAACQPPSLGARYACAFLMVAVFAVWGKIVFVGAENAPQVGGGATLHSALVPFLLTSTYLFGLPILRLFTQTVLKDVDVKLLLKETMVIYNGGQVLLNFWMVYKFIEGVAFLGHPFIGDVPTITAGVTYAIWVHYMDKYLEFFDTVFMVLRGRMDQVSFLHVYHHVSIAWAWWFAMYSWPGGDSYFGALLNSWIHVMMYSYYTLSLLKISCPWKRYLTQCQLLQFCTVVLYSFASAYMHYKQQDLETLHVWCLIVQVFEMTSLFVLFMAFYSRAYQQKKSKAKTQ
eukprot:Nitzschia sp. Nitz4//scaffold82_size85912//74580//75605//NITZ4_005152-RA/size85912-processed-gene-0.17-mRNA-1//1//CDS//3329558868//3748//frame0